MLNCDICFKSSTCLSPDVNQTGVYCSHRALDEASRLPISISVEELRRRRPRLARRDPESNPLGKACLPIVYRTPKEPACDDIQPEPFVLLTAAAAVQRRKRNRDLQQAALRGLHAPQPGTDCPSISRILRETTETPGAPIMESYPGNGHSAQVPTVPLRHPGRANHPTARSRPLHGDRTAPQARLTRSRPLSRSGATRIAPHCHKKPVGTSRTNLHANKTTHVGRSGSCAHCGCTPFDSGRSSANSKLWDAVRRSLSQQSHISSVVSPLEALSMSSSGAVIPSRTSSQKRALNQFTRQLETFAELRGVAGKVPVFTPTPESILSYHTVSALLPYQAEFLKEGLAITSAQQARLHSTANRGSDRIRDALGFQGQPVGQQRRHQRNGQKHTAADHGHDEMHLDGTVRTPASRPCHPRPCSSDETEVVFSGDTQLWDSA